jgi:PKD repeat protein
MTNVASITGSVPNVVTTQSQIPSAVSGAIKSSAQTVSSATLRFVDDPLSGTVVSQYLNNQGNIVSQTPSRAVIAYLQQGLTVDGESRSSTVA